MANGKFVAYYRVSTATQGQSGLGLEAQREAVARYLSDGEWECLAEFQEIETGKGADALAKRPKLKAALDTCRKNGATLIIAKLDRLARNVHFISGLMETGCDFVAADMPTANKVMIQMHAVMSEWERDQISRRTKDALAVAKSRGIILGKAGPKNLQANVQQRQQAADYFVAKLRPVFDGMKARKLSQRAMLGELNSIGIPAPKGGVWQLTQVQRVIARLAAQENS